VSATLPISHEQLQSACDELAQRLGWARLGVRKVPDMRGNWPRYITPWSVDGKGWADRLYVRAPWMLYVDFKTGSGRLEPEQREWMQRMEQFPCVLCFVWRPDSWRSGFIERTLTDPGDLAS
jgi:hypothetical protein